MMYINTKTVISMNFENNLYECSDFSCIFSLVKRLVESTIGIRRAGLSLGLTDLPIQIGAFHQLGSNFIIMNKRLLEEVAKSGDRKLINSYIFHVLLHEYIHSLGFINEQETQILTHDISQKVLGKNHPATLIARQGIGSVFSDFNITPTNNIQEMKEIEIVKDFEMENLNYFG